MVRVHALWGYSNFGAHNPESVAEFCGRCAAVGQTEQDGMTEIKVEIEQEVED